MVRQRAEAQTKTIAASLVLIWAVKDLASALILASMTVALSFTLALLRLGFEKWKYRTGRTCAHFMILAVCTGALAQAGNVLWLDFWPEVSPYLLLIPLSALMFTLFEPLDAPPPVLEQTKYWAGFSMILLLAGGARELKLPFQELPSLYLWLTAACVFIYRLFKTKEAA